MTKTTATHLRLIFGRACKALEQFDRASIAGTGLNASDFMILEALLHKGPLAINAIGAKVLLTSGSMTAAANRLEKKRLVARRQDPEDGRSYRLHLTDAGRALISEAFRGHSENLDEVFAVLTEKEREELALLLKKLGYRAQSINRT